MRKSKAALEDLMMRVLFKAGRCEDEKTPEQWYQVFAELMFNPTVH